MLRYVVLMVLLAPGLAAAWGGTGHEVVCEIAFNELNDDVRRTVARLIRQDDEYKTFAASCNWPDRPRKRDEEHYVNLPRSTRAITADECPLAESCLFSAIRHDVGVLSDANASDAQKLEALKFLGHWVGDIHQPMHVTYQDDRGANSIELESDSCEQSLHGGWDDCIIRDSLGDRSRRIAERLRDAISAADRARWQHDSPVEWANESYQLATSAEAQYCTWRDGACWYSVDNMMLQRGEPRRTVAFDDRYVAAHSATVERRLQQAGVRLGALLNRALK